MDTEIINLNAKSEDISFRVATEKDYDTIYKLVEKAFKTADVSDGTEQDFVVSLRNGETYIPGLEFVALDGEKIIGHIMMTEQIISDHKENYIGVLVAPLSVAIEYRNRRVGGLLMKEACNAAIKKGYEAAFLVGDPSYYSRFAFKQIGKYDIKNDTSIPDKFVMGKELTEDALKNIKGTISLIL